MKNTLTPAVDTPLPTTASTIGSSHNPWHSTLNRLNRKLKGKAFSGSRYFILVDENTYTHCLPLLVSSVETFQQAEFIEVPVGEAAKGLAIAQQLWETLLESHADRDTILVNLGGGCVSDLGGFVAAGYQRGIRYINIPTTLVGMVDASIGGKTAVNLLDSPSGQQVAKNQVGFFHSPTLTCIEPAFLDTLPSEDFNSGLCEMIKTLLIGNPEQYDRLCTLLLSADSHQPSAIDSQSDIFLRTLVSCVEIKSAIVKADPFDRSTRHILNLGHTAGHAIEAYSHLPHGLSVGIGLWCALYLSVHKIGLDPAVLERYTSVLRTLTTIPHYTLKDTEALLSLMRLDKKNRLGTLRCVLLQQPGVPVIDVEVHENEMRQALLSIQK